MQIKPNNPNFNSGPNIGGWSPQSNEKVNQEALKLAKLLQQGGYSQSLKN